MCEKAIQRPLKMRDKMSFMLTVFKATQFVLKQVTALLALVKRSLEDESDIALLTAQLLSTEGTGSVKGVCPMGQRDLTPEGGRFIRAHMTTGVKGMSGWGSVNIEARLTAQPKRDVWALGAAHGTLSEAALAPLPFLQVSAPVMVAVHVSAVQINPGLLLIRSVLASHGGESQSVKAHGTLRTRRIDLLSERLQVFESGSASQTFSCSPQQCRTTQVNERTIHQLLALGLHHLASLLSRACFS